MSVSMEPKPKVAIVGGGSWGTTIASIIAKNTAKDEYYSDKVFMWVYEEIFEGRNLTEIINTDHINKKYLPSIKLPDGVIATNDLIETVSNADVIMFAVPRKFLPSVLQQLNRNIKKSAIIVSLIKGLDFSDGKPQLLSEMIRNRLDIKQVGVLMGANVAKDVIKEQFVESTLGCSDACAQIVIDLLDCDTFSIELCEDVEGVEMCGALKNVVAMGAGFCDSIGFGESSKAAIIRRGMEEMVQLCRLFFPSFQLETILRSCGIADVVASSYGGRNRLCAKEFGSRVLQGASSNMELWSVVERELLEGQKLEGLETCIAIHEALQHRQMLDQYPLFRRIFEISCAGASPHSIFSWK